jgi:hypothetical protein
MLGFKPCPGCIERREKIKEIIDKTKAWYDGKRDSLPPFMTRPEPPVRIPPVFPEVKKDQRKKD